MKKNILFVSIFTLIAVCMTAFYVLAEENTSRSSVCLGVSELADYTTSNTEADYIVLGYYNNSDIRWRVLSKTGNDGAYIDAFGTVIPNSLLLLSEKELGTSIVNGYYKVVDGVNKQYDRDSTWANSKTKKWCSDFPITSVFLSEEQNNILYTTKGKSAGKSIIDALITERLFLLSSEEARNYLPLESDRSLATKWYWWLRTGESYSHGLCVHDDGTIWTSDTTSQLACRPAMNFNRDSIILISDPISGKSKTIGELTKPDDYTGHEWKLTLADASHKSFTADLVSQNKSDLVISYSNAVAGSDEYVTAVITNGDSGTLKYYGKLKNITSSDECSGKLNLTLPKDYNADKDTLYILQERCFTSTLSVYSDYSSALQKIETHKHSLTPYTFEESIVCENDYWKCGECGECFQDESKTQPISDPDLWQDTLEESKIVSFSLKSKTDSKVTILLAGYDSKGKMIYLSPSQNYSLKEGINDIQFSVDEKSCDHMTLVFLDPETFAPICQAVEREDSKA